MPSLHNRRTSGPGRSKEVKPTGPQGRNPGTPDRYDGRANLRGGPDTPKGLDRDPKARVIEYR